MNWHYAAKKFSSEIEEWYGLVEVFDEDMHTENEVTVNGASPEELAMWLRQAADDVEKYGVVNDTDDGKKMCDKPLLEK